MSIESVYVGRSTAHHCSSAFIDLIGDLEETMATMFPEDMGQYPFLLDLLHELKTLPVRRARVFELFLEYSDLTRSKALAALEFGTRPWVVVESGPFTWGNYDWSNSARRAPRDTIALNSDFVNDFEIIGRWHKKWLARHAPSGLY